jgi:hypothetical protein
MTFFDAYGLFMGALTLVVVLYVTLFMKSDGD